MKSIIQHSQGYRLVYAPDHPRASSKGYALEHIVMAEQALGRPLPAGVQVHHVDMDRGRNVGNLVICQDQAYHQLLHRRTNALMECGNANYVRCAYCSRYDDPSNLVNHGPRANPELQMCHRECRRAANRRTRGIGL